MASIKKKSSGGGGANWMDTYGDMVTLLLCFFVLLYSISTIDQQKWMWVVQSFNKDAIVSITGDPTGPDGDNEDEGGSALPITDEVDHAMEALYEFLAQYAQNNQEAASISVSRGDGYVFISFEDAVFFNGDSYALRPEGQRILDAIIGALNTAGPYIDELRVLGHTAQRVANEPNPPVGDRFLASNRATEVTLYLQQHVDQDRLDPGRLVSVGYGQWRPISSNDTGETRARNRRVELVVTGRDLENVLGNSYNQYFAMYQEASDQEVTGQPEH